MKRVRIYFLGGLITFIGGTLLAAWWAKQHWMEESNSESSSNCVVNFSEGRYRDDGDEWVALLVRFKEMPMQDFPTCVDESYRVDWFPTFHSPIAVRIWRSGEKVFLTAKQLDGKGGYGLGNLKNEVTRQLTDEEWLEATRLIQSTGFWDLPPIETALPPNDGALWVIEGRANGLSRAIHRRVPDTEFSAVCIYLLKLSGLQTDVDKY